MMSLLPRAVRPEHLATALGVFYALFYLGMAVSQTVAGHLRDVTGDAAMPLLFASGLMLATIAAVVGVLAHRGPPGGRLIGMREPGDVLLVACYELGHQPLAVAWPAAFLERAGYAPALMDVSVEPFDAEKLARAKLVAVSVPMHTALRLGRRGRRARPRGQPRRATSASSGSTPAQRRVPARPRRRLRDRRRGRGAAGGADRGARARRPGAGAGGRAPGPGRRARISSASTSRCRAARGCRRSRSTRTSSATGARSWPATWRRAAGACTSAGTARSRRCTAGASSRCRARWCWPTSRQQVEAGATPRHLRRPGLPQRARATRSRWRGRCTPRFPTSPSTSRRRSSTCCATARSCPSCGRSAALFVVSAVESLSDTVLAHLDKGHTRADVVTALAATRAAGHHAAAHLGGVHAVDHARRLPRDARLRRGARR